MAASGLARRKRYGNPLRVAICDATSAVTVSNPAAAMLRAFDRIPFFYHEKV